MQWKQWATDEAWSTPVHILSASDAAMLKRWHPAAANMEFPSAGAPIIAWLGHLEAWCSSQPAGSDYLGLHNEFTWLRAAVSHTLPGTYAPGKRVDDILRDLRALPHRRPEARAPGEQIREFPQDIVAQLYPSADVPIVAHDALVRIEGLTHNSAQYAKRSNDLVVGSLIVVAAPDGTRAHGQSLPIVVGQVLDTFHRNVDSLLVAWFLPQLARLVNYRGGQKKQILDVYGPWVPAEEWDTAELTKCKLPSPVIYNNSVLEANFNLTESQTLPYDVFDALRNRHGIDLTGFNLSMTRYGNLYRNYVLMRGNQ